MHPVVSLVKHRRVRHTLLMLFHNNWFICLALLACRPVAAELRLMSLEVKPRVYSNVVVLGANETDLYFKHDKGVMNVKLKQLSPDLQMQFGYDPAKAAAAEKQRAEEERRYAESIAQASQSETLALARGPATLGEDSLIDSLSDQSLLNRPAPELAVEKWIGEKPILQGKWAVILFWSAASPPSCRVIPELNAWQKKFAERLAVAGICPQNEKQLNQMTEPKVEFFTATDSKGKLAAAVGVTTIPQILLLDPKHIVRYQGHPAALNEKILQKLFASYPGD
jgi:cytochrome c biogenesis protein CcmG, thiol:disulfide interchange protein DsbE